MRLTIERSDPDAVLVRCSGQITHNRLSPVADPLVALVGPDGLTKAVVFDLAGVEYLDSSGVGWLLGCQRRCQQAGGRLVLSRVPPLVAQVLQACGLERFFHVLGEDKG